MQKGQIVTQKREKGAAGVNEWFDKIYRENVKRLRKAAKNKLGDVDWAEDAVQEVFVLLLKKQDKLRGHVFLRGWLYLTLGNVIRNERKRRSNQQDIPLQDIRELGIEDTYDIPLSEVLPKELTPREREIIILRFEKQFSHAQIAQQLGCSPSASRATLSRAIARCRELLSDM